MINVYSVTRALMVSLLVLTLPTYGSAQTRSRDLAARSPLDLGEASKHTGQVSFGFGTNGAFSQMSGTYSLSPRLYARYGFGTSQGLGQSNQFTSGLTGNRGLGATSFLLSLGSPSVFQFRGGIDVGAEAFVANGPVFQRSLHAPGSLMRGLDLFNHDSSHFMSPWDQRARDGDPLTAGKTWFLEFEHRETTSTGTRGGRVTIGK